MKHWKVSVDQNGVLKIGQSHIGREKHINIAIVITNKHPST